MRRVDYLITQARRTTGNEEFTEGAGIADEEFLQAANDAQDELQSIIQSMFPDVFQDEQEISLTAGLEQYDIPSDAFLGNRVDMVEYSNSGNVRDYYPLKKGSKRERMNGVSGIPSFYLRRSGKLLLQPKPQSSGAKIRVLYQKALPKLDKRRATVAAAVLTSTAVTSLTLDTTVLIDDGPLLEDGYITIVDADGAVQMRRIPISAINTTTGIVTVVPGFTFESGETIAAGDYALRGRESSTHSQLTDICEKYLTEYMCLRILMRDSSVDSQEVSNLLLKFEETIRKSMAEPDGDVTLVPVTDTQYMDWD